MNKHMLFVLSICMVSMTTLRAVKQQIGEYVQSRAVIEEVRRRAEALRRLNEAGYVELPAPSPTQGTPMEIEEVPPLVTPEVIPDVTSERRITPAGVFRPLTRQRAATTIEELHQGILERLEEIYNELANRLDRLERLSRMCTPIG